MGDHVDFYEVDGGCARELVALADVRNFPVRIVPLHSAHLCTPQRQLCRHTLYTPMQLASPHSSPRRTMHTINSALFCRSRKYTHEARYARRAQSTARFSSTGSTRAWWTWCSSSPTSARPSKAGDPDSRSPKEPCTRGKHMHHRMLVSTFYT
jgi:hypothetical protein